MHPTRLRRPLVYLMILVLCVVPWKARPAEETPNAATKVDDSKLAVGDAPKKKTGATEGGEKAKPTPTPALGPALGGYFDLSVFRSSQRVTQFRRALDPLIVQLPDRWRARIQCTVEFGNASGAMELSRIQTPLLEELKGVAARFAAADLRSTAGKLRLKDAMTATLNRRLQTAQVRTIYFTEFRLGR